MRATLVLILFLITTTAVFSAEYSSSKFIVAIDREFLPRLNIEKNVVATTGIPEIDSLNRRFGVSDIRLLIRRSATSPRWKRYNNIFVFVYEDSTDAQIVCNEYRKLLSVEFSHPSWLDRYCLTPDDPFFSSQWMHQNIQSEFAWGMTRGSRTVILAALDSGIDWDHPDIMGNIWVNPGEDLDGDGELFDIDDMDGLDNDLNGYIDDLIGYDFIDNCRDAYPGEDGDDPDNDPSDFILDGHGTHIYGIMGAVGNNAIGVVGVNWNVSLMALRSGYLRDDGEGFQDYEAKANAIIYAVENGADVINMSFGSYHPDDTFNDLIQDAWEAGVILVAAAGNEATSARSYPACYSHVISVAATNRLDLKTDFSNYGYWVDISAPGENIMSTFPDDTYQTLSGTSMSSPIVAGAAGLLLSYFPDSSNEWIVSRLLGSADPIDSLNPDSLRGKLGTGRLNLFNAIGQLVFPSIHLFSYRMDDIGGNEDNIIDPGETGEIIFSFCNDPGWHTATDILLTVSTTDPTVTILDDTVYTAEIAPGDTQEIPVRLSFTPDTTAHRVRFRWEIHSAERRRFIGSINPILGRPEILLVDASGDPTYREAYTIYTLAPLHLVWHTWDKYSQGIPSLSDITPYRTIVWFTGDSIPTTEEAELLCNYMDTGGKSLLLTGQYIGNAIGGTALFSGYLGAEHTSDNVGSRFFISGVNSIPHTDSIMVPDSIIVTGGIVRNQVNMSGATPIGTGIGVLRYEGDPDENYAGIFNENSTVYLGFGFEAINDAPLGFSSKYQLGRRILEYLGYDFSGVKEEKKTEKKSLLYTFPTPCNATAYIEFYLPEDDKISISLYNIKGERLLIPVSGGFFTKGRHRLQADLTGLSTGLYIVSLKGKHSDCNAKLLYLK